MSTPNADGREWRGDRLAEHVTDPDDYNRTQRFKEIHRARQRISEHVSEMDIPKEGGVKYSLQNSSRLAYLVALYVYELEPLIVQSECEEGDLIPKNNRYDSLRDFARGMGMVIRDGADNKVPSPMTVMQVYSAANRFYAQVGMDLELAEDEGDAGFDYSDILEEGPPGEGEKPEIESVEDDR